MNIAIDYTAGLVQRAGVGRYTRGLVQALTADPQGDTYTLLYTRDAEPAAADVRPAFPEHVRWQRLPFTQRQAALLWQRVRLPLPGDRWAGDADIYHSPDFVLPPLKRARGIVTVHDLSFLVRPEFHEPSLARYLQRAVPRSVEQAAHIFADSEYTRQELQRHLGVAPERVSVVYPGVEPRFRPYDFGNEADHQELMQVRAAFSLDAPFILFVGTIEPRKNIRTLIRAYRLLRQKMKFVFHELIIAGGIGWGESDDIYTFVDDLRLGGHVLFAGYVADAFLPALYNLADLVVYPSHYEGFGLPVLEAMACGTPVVTGRNTSLPEVGGDAVLYVDDVEDEEALAEAMHRALNDKELRAELRQKGLEHAKRFTWERAAEQARQAYRRLV
ncbi:glycosyltransferase family 4 protein [Ardenticatena maritima]|nr:glycosyltransferase family 1 protein [Ardenticatena maritima]KPL88391.1 hypothetical protein SE16_06135 [Ardenticatena maritima]